MFWSVMVYGCVLRGNAWQYKPKEQSLVQQSVKYSKLVHIYSMTLILKMQIKPTTSTKNSSGVDKR